MGRAESGASVASSQGEGKSGGDGKDAATKLKQAGASLMTKEERYQGAVGLTTYRKYLTAAGGMCLFAGAYLLFVVTMANTLLSTYWVSLWTTSAANITAAEAAATGKRAQVPYTVPSWGTFAFYMAGYPVIAIVLACFTFLRTNVLAMMGVKASSVLHTKLVEQVLHAPQEFFDTTPIGRIISRFSKDLHLMDDELVNYLDFFFFTSLFVFATLVTITFVTPWFGLAALVAFVVYVVIINYFRHVSRESKRLESVARSPVYAHYSETLGGTSTIRAFNATQRFLEENAVKIDLSIEGYYVNKVADRWLSIRLELLGAFIGLLAALMIVAKAVQLQGSNEQDEAFVGLAGLSLTYAISVTGLLNWTVRSFAQMESAMSCSERVFHYIDNVPQERVVDAKDPVAVAASHIPSNWPDRGGIVLKDLKMRYRKDMPLVLRGIDVNIEGGSRVGVVGRTGSGKSSLLLCLLRLVEPEPLTAEGDGGGSITIDGVDISKIRLQDLRRKIAIIPQNPTLFSGTIRSNLDPFEEYSDESIWKALALCEMEPTVRELEGGLQAPVSEYGENLSQGQRQLLCLGRAALLQCRVLLLDEATSALDLATDAMVQKTLATAFLNSTIITIAHRVNTIIESDLILVLGEGKLAECGTPAELLADEKSHFSSMTAELGQATAAKLLEQATENVGGKERRAQQEEVRKNA